MKISASIYSNKDQTLEQTVRDADLLHIDYLHVDCNDDPAVFEDIAFVRSCSRTPIDLHLITSDPTKYYDLIEKNRVEWLTLQHELLPENFEFPKHLRSRLGISFTGATPVEEFDSYKDDCAFILFMTTQPGQSGGKFDQVTFQRIRDFKARYPDRRVHVDGGVNAEIAFVLKTLGVYCAVSGSFLVCAADMAAALMGLRGRADQQEMILHDFMRSLHETPMIVSNDISVSGILKAIDTSRLGFVTVVSEQGLLEGLVTDGDVRRALLRNIDDPRKIFDEDLVNWNPIFVSETMTVNEMLRELRKFGRPILFLPVVGEGGKLTGSVIFSEIVKGEL